MRTHAPATEADEDKRRRFLTAEHPLLGYTLRDTLSRTARIKNRRNPGHSAFCRSFPPSPPVCCSQPFEFRVWLRCHTAERRRFGYRRLHILLRHEGIKLNHKKLSGSTGESG